MEDRFTGKESPAEILKMVLDEYSLSPVLGGPQEGSQIVYQDGFPVLQFQAFMKNGWGGFACYYRLDNILLAIFPECEKMYDEAADNGFFGTRKPIERDAIVRYLAHSAMSAMIPYLMSLQFAVFEEGFNDTRFVTAGGFFHALAHAHYPPEKERIAEKVNEVVKTQLKSIVKAVGDKKRARIKEALKQLELLHIPTGLIGRTPGVKNKKTAEQQNRENTEHRKLIINAMSAIYRRERAKSEVLAEDKIYKKAVAGEMNISRTTLNAWLESGGYEFDDLKNEAISVSSKN